MHKVDFYEKNSLKFAEMVILMQFQRFLNSNFHQLLINDKNSPGQESDKDETSTFLFYQHNYWNF